MNRKRITVIQLCVLLVFLAAASSALFPRSASAASGSKKLLTDVRKAPVKSGRWIQRGNRWKYRYKDKTYARSTWLNVNGKYYYFKSGGYMASGWITYNKKRYFLKSSGEMATGWISYKNNWYYLSKNGSMLSNRFLKAKGSTYYLESDGKMASGWKTISGRKYYFKPSGNTASGWSKIGRSWYYLKKDGSLGSYRKASQILFVKASGSSAELTMLEKKSGETWKEVLKTNGYVGRLGVGKKAREGVAITPEGTYSFGLAFGNLPNPGTLYPYTKVDASHYWVDDSSSRFYNQFVSTNNVSMDWNSGEHLIEYPTAYAYAISLNFNTECVPGAGSAIFLHCDGGGPTAGCIAVPKKDMIYILRHLKKDAVINIGRK